MLKFVQRKVLTMTGKSIHFFQLNENTYYKIVNVQSVKKDATSRQLVFITEGGHRLFGHFGVDEIFNMCSVLFFFKYKVLAETLLFKRFKICLCRDAAELVSENYQEMEHILMNYIARKVCKGCILNHPNQMIHICTNESKIELSKKYFSKALKEHPNYQVGNVLDAFVKYIGG